MSAYLTRRQIDVLLGPIKAGRVSKDRDGMSHLQVYDVRAHLNRVLGFGRWSADVLDVTMLYEVPAKLSTGKEGFSAAYRATLRLTVCAPDGSVLATYTECATGDGTMPAGKRADAHDFAIKTAESQALKRCAMNLGDQFGLSLYAQGSLAAVVKTTLVGIDAPNGDVQPESVTAESAAEPSNDPPAPNGQAPPNAARAGADAVRREIAKLATDKGWPLPDVIAQFHEWTQGGDIMATTPEILTSFLGNLRDGTVAVNVDA